MVTKDGVLGEEYQYGPNGTRTYEMNALRGIPGREFTYSDEDHLLTAEDLHTSAVTSYQYDVDGFLTKKTITINTQGELVTTYDYSSRGELLQVNLPDGRVIEYIHDPLGRRIAKKVNGIITEKYLWQGLTRLLAVYDVSDDLIMRFEYADARMPVAMTKDGSTYYLTYDQVGSLMIVADASGNVVKRIDYDSFGNIISDTNPSFELPFGFAGGLHDRDTGLVRFGYRDYDPDTGRWTAKDTIFFAGGDTDLYGYCFNDPINWVDDIGLIVLPPDPSGLPYCWEFDPSHKHDWGLRYRHPSGAILDFHIGRPWEADYWKKRDHWHYNKAKKHLLPGTTIPGGECPEPKDYRNFWEQFKDAWENLKDFIIKITPKNSPIPCPLPPPVPMPIPVP